MRMVSIRFRGDRCFSKNWAGFETLQPINGANADSYVERVIKKKSVDKVELAALTTPLMTVENMRGRFDWEDRMKKVVEVIRTWARN